MTRTPLSSIYYSLVILGNFDNFIITGSKKFKCEKRGKSTFFTRDQIWQIDKTINFIFIIYHQNYLKINTYSNSNLGNRYKNFE